LGELTGLGFTGEYGLYAGQDTNYTYLLLTDTSFEAHGLDLKLYEGTTNTVWLDPATPKFVMGDGASTDTYASGNGIWMGVDSGTYKMRIGNSASGVFYYTGVDVRIYGDSGDYLKASGTGMEFISDGNAWFTVKDSTVTVGRVAGGEYVTVSSSGIYLYGGTYNTMQLLSSGDVLIGQSTGSIGNLWYDYSASTLYLRRGTTNIISLPSSGDAQIVGTLDIAGAGGAVTWASGTALLDQTGITITVGNLLVDVDSYKFMNVNTNIIGSVMASWLTDSTVMVRSYGETTAGADAYLILRAHGRGTGSFGKVSLETYHANSQSARLELTSTSTSAGFCQLLEASMFIGPSGTTAYRSGTAGYLGVEFDLQVGGGLVVGNYTTNPANGMAIITGGLRVGDTGTPVADRIAATGDINAGGGFIVGSSNTDVTGGQIWFNDSNCRIYDNGSNSLRVYNNYGYVDIGGNASDQMVFSTADSIFTFNKSVYSTYAIVSGNAGVVASNAGSTSNGVYIQKHDTDGHIWINHAAESSLWLNYLGSYLRKTRIGNGSNTYGDIHADNFNNESTLKSKRNVRSLKSDLDISPLELVEKIRPLAFEKDNTGSKRRIGMAAEELYEVLPEVVAIDENGDPEGIAYGQIVPLLILAIQDLTAEIERLKQ
jgi:hypothetical protein